MSSDNLNNIENTMNNEQLLEICKAIDLSLLWENEQPTDYLRNKYVRMLLPEDETARYHAYVDKHPEENETIYRLQEKLFGDVPESVLISNDNSTQHVSAPERIYTIQKPGSSTQSFVELEPFCHLDVKSIEYIRADKVAKWEPIENMPDELKKDGARFMVPNCTVKSPITGWKAEEPIIVHMRGGIMYFDNSLSHKISGVTHYLDIRLLSIFSGEIGDDK